MLVGALAALATVAALAIAADDTGAAQIDCGDTITADTTLRSDLIDCPNNGIVIGADNVTLDLNGHSIEGDGELVDPCEEDFCDFGIVSDGHDGVTIEGGAVTEFGVGVAAFDGAHARLRRLIASHIIFPAILFGGLARSEVSRISVFANGLDTDNSGLAVFDSREIELERSSISGNGDIGLFAIGLDDSRIANNEWSDNPEAAMIVEGDGNAIGRNRVLRNGDGIILDGSENTVTRNHVFASTGCPDGCGFGISLEGGRQNLIARNLVGGAVNAGIRLGAFDPAGLRNSAVIGNHVRGGGGDGVLVQRRVEGTVLDGNHAVGVRDDGIDVNESATTLTGNHAVQNADLGIEAVAGVTDGGKNKANINGDPRQCTHVACG